MIDLETLYPQVAQSIAHIMVLSDSGSRVASGTGFLIAGKLVTCAHVLAGTEQANVRVRFPHAVGEQTVEWDYPRFGARPEIKGWADEQSFDYAIVEPPQGAVVGKSLSLVAEEPAPGAPVAILGFPFEDPHLTMHSGHVSAVYDSGVARMIKLDMSVNPSNSGGPLIRLSDGQVIGIVARKATGLTRAFGDLMASFDANIALFEQVKGAIGLAGIDFGWAFGVSQTQMRSVALELERSANVGIGYAVLATPLDFEAALQT